MEGNFKFEIVSPEKIIFSENASMVTFPSYEGDMSILKNHISIITFLRPGIVKIEKDEKNTENFFIQEGTVEYFNDSLVILSSTAENIKNLSQEFIKTLSKDAEDKLLQKDITDHDRYMLNHKIDALKEIRV
jgi:ATP synthase F1 epsilon subunit